VTKEPQHTTGSEGAHGQAHAADTGLAIHLFRVDGDTVERDVLPSNLPSSGLEDCVRAKGKTSRRCPPVVCTRSPIPVTRAPSSRSPLAGDIRCPGRQRSPASGLLPHDDCAQRQSLSGCLQSSARLPTASLSPADPACRRAAQCARPHADGVARHYRRSAANWTDAHAASRIGPGFLRAVMEME